MQDTEETVERGRRRGRSEPRENTEPNEEGVASVTENLQKPIWPDTRKLASPGGGQTSNGSECPRERTIHKE